MMNGTWQGAVSSSMRGQTGRMQNARQDGRSAARPEKQEDPRTSLFNQYLRVASNFGNVDGSRFSAGVAAYARMPYPENSLSAESADLVVRYMPVILGALALDEGDFRNLCAGAIGVERGMDGRPAAELPSARGHQRDGAEKPPCTVRAYIGQTQFSPAALDGYADAVESGFVSLNGTMFSRAVDRAMSTMAPEAMASVGEILSDFPYLVRALNHNYKFYGTMRQAIGAVCRKYNFRSV